MPRKVLLVGWDAADWKVIRPLIGAGKMPNVQRLVEEGATGQIATLHPPLSPMLWTSIATGMRPFKHGVHGFTEPAPDGSGVRPVTSLSRRVKALWNILSQNQLRSIVIGWWPSHPVEPIRGVMVSDGYLRASGPLDAGWPMPAETVHPPHLAETLAGLRVHPDQITVEMVERFVPRAREIDQEKDHRLGFLMRTLAECMSIQSAAAWLIRNEPWDFFAVYFESIDHFCHSFMRCHPPRQATVGEREFELYRDVVSVAYQHHDEMLGALLEKAGEDTTVILMSDHGFHPDHLRPASIPNIPAGPAVEHRDFGVFAISGPGIQENAPLESISVLDVAPTVLQLFDLPVGEDMDGRVMTRAFVKTPRVATLPSWEQVSGDDGRHPPHTRLDPVAAHEALEQMIALGYIEAPDADRETAIRKTIRELRSNLAESYQDAGRHAEARDIFLELAKSDPDDQRFAIGLFVSCEALGLLDEMRRIVTSVAERRAAAIADRLKARVLIAEKRYAEALAVLEPLDDEHLFREIADLKERLGRLADAQRAYENALRRDPDDAHAHLGLCRLALRRRQYGAAAHAALDALALVHQQPVAHFLLARALAAMKEYKKAADALRAAIALNPNFPRAHLRLAGLLEKHLGDAAAAREHRTLARTMRRGGHPSMIDAPVADESELPPGETDGPPTASLAESLIVVSGLPRSGTSLLMQMLAAGGMEVVTDRERAPDENNPRGYLEFERVRSLRRDARWLTEMRGKAIKIVAPLIDALPPGLPCRVLWAERDPDEVLESQERMLGRQDAPERRRLLKSEYARASARAKAMLAQRPATELLDIEYADALAEPEATAERISRFLGGELNVPNMAAVVDPALHRSRSRPATTIVVG